MTDTCVICGAVAIDHFLCDNPQCREEYDEIIYDVLGDVTEELEF